MTRKASAKGQLQGNVFLLTGDQQYFAATQIELLQAVGECGSISKAAQAVGISYKTAWDRIDAMNNLSSQPLVSRAAGGTKGGGTTLTDLGQRVVEGFKALQLEHQLFIERLGDRLHSLNDVANFIQGASVKTSARNQFLGRITNIAAGKVSAEIEVDIGIAQPIYAAVTLDSIKNLRLKKADEVLVLVKAPAVMVATDAMLKTSARNHISGVISRINTGTVNSEILVDLGDGKTICALITDASVKALKLKQGQSACAVFNAPSVTLLKGR